MMKNIKRIVRASWENSPKANWSILGIKMHGWLFNDHAPRPLQVIKRGAEVNWVLGDLRARPEMGKLIPLKLPAAEGFLLLGSSRELDFLNAVLTQRGCLTQGLEWDWKTEIPTSQLPPGWQILVANLPVTEAHWIAMRRLRESFPRRVTGLDELALPFTTLQMAHSLLDYWGGKPEQLAAYYTGEQFMGPLRDLNNVFPLGGKTIIEYGPLEGCQTAGLLHHGAKAVTCIEGRPENFIKTLLACQTFGWRNVNLCMDDFHNADAAKYGRFDLAFAHGTYYHSVAPFLFLENLVSLADNIFIGGYCATPARPIGPFETMPYSGETYLAKKYEEPDYFMNGVNGFGYIFDGDDLMKFFRVRGFAISVISDSAEEGGRIGGKYLRFLARREPLAA